MEDYGIKMATIPVDMPRATMAQDNRFAYFERFHPIWLSGLRYRAYAFGLAAVGLFLIPSFPIGTALAWAGAAYFYQRMKLAEVIVNSPRRLVQLL